MLIRKLGSVAVAGVFFGLAAGGAKAEKTILLRHHWKRNGIMQIQLALTQKIEQAVPGRPFYIEQTTHSGFTYWVQDVAPNGDATILAKFRSLSLEQKSPYGNITYDSTQPGVAIQPEAQYFAALKGQSFTFQCTPLGGISKIVGVDRMVAAMLRSPGLPVGPMRDAIEKNIRELYTPGYMSEIMTRMSPQYPAGSIHVGSRWSVTELVNKPFPMRLGIAYRLTAMHGGIADITIAANIRSTPRKSVYDLPGQRVSILLSGVQNGTMQVNTETGWQRNLQYQQHITGRIEVHSAGQLTPTSWPITISARGRVTSTP